MPSVPDIPGSAIESFMALGGTTNLFTLAKPAISVSHITATESFEFDITRMGGLITPVDLIAKKPRTGNYPLRLWFVDFSLTSSDQLPTTFTVDMVDTDSNPVSQVYTRGPSPTVLPSNTASVASVTATLGILPWVYRLGLDVGIYAMGVEPAHNTIPDGQPYHFSGTNTRRLALGDDYLVDNLGRIRVLTNLVGSSEVVIDYNFAVRSALTGW